MTRYSESKVQLSIFQNHVNGTLFCCWVTRLLFCLNHFMLITFDNEVWLCRQYPLTLDNIFKLSFIIVVVVNFISVASILGHPSIARVLCYPLNFGQLDNNQRKPPEKARDNKTYWQKTENCLRLRGQFETAQNCLRPPKTVTFQELSKTSENCMGVLRTV